MRHWLFGLLVLVATAASADPAAWRVGADRGDAPGELLLLGSIHYLREEDYPLPARVDELYAEADALVLELGPDDLDPARVQAAFLAAALLPPGRSLDDALTQDLYAEMARNARDLGIDPAMLDRFQPWMVALTLMDLVQAREGFRGDLGLEQHLLRRARRDGLEVSGLETLEAQIAVFAHLSEADQQALLEQTLRELSAVGESMESLAIAWRRGELGALADELLDEFRDFPQLYEALVTERNAAWVPRLEALLAHGRRHLVVVGALHLVGPDSVIELLEARGWRIQPVD